MNKRLRFSFDNEKLHEKLSVEMFTSYRGSKCRGSLKFSRLQKVPNFHDIFLNIPKARALPQFVKTHKPEIDDALILEIMVKVLLGLDYLQEKHTQMSPLS